MRPRRVEVFRLATTPGELRELADTLQAQWDAAGPGDRQPSVTYYGTSSEVEFVVDADEMARLKWLAEDAPKGSQA